ncbi:zinc finger CCCH domain-containing protein 1-like [Miscanthus floridulus]|uniref:zinc finger CCCH domain-containing protein 1-like n=1 Tax=Miscanthus floridulus TaxID=154761 RepID=UPI00345A89BC
MESEGNAAAAGAGHWEAPNGVIVLPVGSAAPRFLQQEPQYLQRKREMEREQQDPGAAGADPGVLGLDLTQPPEKVYYKTRLCEKFEAGKCAYEDGCTFAHGFDELRPPLPVPTSLIRRRSPLRPRSSSPGAAADGSQGGGGYLRVCFEFRDTGACHRGDRCAFAHASPAEMPFPGGPRSVEHALRNASPYAKAYSSPGSAAAAHRSSSSYAPSSTRSFPSVPADVAGEGRRRKVTRLELLSRKKMSGIYGDWPEQD